jgi:hypothetical protein
MPDPHLIIAGAARMLGTWPAFGILFLLSAVFFGVLVPRAKAPIFANAAAALPHKVLDEYIPSWTPRIAASFLAGIGPEGRAAYRRFYWIMDFWFPGAVAALANASLLLIAFPPGAGGAPLCVMALLSWLFDAAENVTHFRMAGRYPDLPPLALRLGPVFTGAKWLFAILPLPIALIGLILRLA